MDLISIQLPQIPLFIWFCPTLQTKLASELLTNVPSYDKVLPNPMQVFTSRLRIRLPQIMGKFNNKVGYSSADFSFLLQILFSFLRRFLFEGNEELLSFGESFFFAAEISYQMGFSFFQ